MHYGVRAFSYYLCMKKFIAETDHKNLLYMEQSEAYIVIRWRIYLQSFNMLLRHIPGRTNVVADWGSRMYGLPLAEEDQAADTGADEGAEAKQDGETPLQHFDMEEADWSQVIAEVHSGRGLHPSAKQTWSRLNKYFEGHHIPFRAIQDFVRTVLDVRRTGRPG